MERNVPIWVAFLPGLWVTTQIPFVLLLTFGRPTDMSVLGSSLWTAWIVAEAVASFVALMLVMRKVTGTYPGTLAYRKLGPALGRRSLLYAVICALSAFGAYKIGGLQHYSRLLGDQWGATLVAESRDPSNPQLIEAERSAYAKVKADESRVENAILLPQLYLVLPVIVLAWYFILFLPGARARKALGSETAGGHVGR